MSALYPLRFVPVFRRYLWGGRRLGTVLHKPIGDGDDYAESWEVVDHGEDQSQVAYGSLVGVTLGRLLADHPRELLGRHAHHRRFPLLLKYLDCQRDLSVQVHPNDQQAAQLHPPDLGKTEAWHILEARPGSKLYAGLKRGLDRGALEREVAGGTTEQCLHVIEPRAGDTLLIPAGVVHALGAGLLVAEIQQASDTTFRLFDWNRCDAAGQPRTLHVQASLDTIDYRAGPVSPLTPKPTDRDYAELLVSCDKFVWERWSLREPVRIGGDGRCRIMTVLDGEVELDDDPADQPLGLGQAMLLPASYGPGWLRSHGAARLLIACLPEDPAS